MNLKNLTHHLLIATPQMPDPRFAGSVIYICRHDEQGALGLIINKPIDNLTVYKLFDDLDIFINNNTLKKKPALDAGPLHPEVGFILHTGQPTWASSFAIAENICLTTSLDILSSIASEPMSTAQKSDYQQPKDNLLTTKINVQQNFHLCLGHSSWGKEQIKNEIQQGDWLVCPANLELIFSVPFAEKWQKAGETIGINMNFLSCETGKA